MMKTPSFFLPPEEDLWLSDSSKDFASFPPYASREPRDDTLSGRLLPEPQSLTDDQPVPAEPT